jgi:hypothetical protein
MKSSRKKLTQRGLINQSDIIPYISLKENELLNLMNSESSHERSIAAELLSNFPKKEVIKALCLGLSIEKKLYTKLNICKSLMKIGKQAVPEMLKYLGKIGRNQYKEIPEEEFRKKSYPLARDIIARTLAHMNMDILPELTGTLDSDNINATREVIDSIGFICFYNESDYPVPHLIKCYKKNNYDAVIKWKIIRSFRSFNNRKVIEMLEEIICNEPNFYLKREAEISLGIIRNRNK